MFTNIIIYLSCLLLSLLEISFYNDLDTHFKKNVINRVLSVKIMIFCMKMWILWEWYLIMKKFFFLGGKLMWDKPKKKIYNFIWDLMSIIVRVISIFNVLPLRGWHSDVDLRLELWSSIGFWRQLRLR